MKLLALLSSVVSIPALVNAISVSSDTIYDNAGQSLATVACSDGSFGLLTRGFTTFSSLPKFPYIGGAPAVKRYNSPDCGTCWNLTFINAVGSSKTISILAIDLATPDFNIAQSAFSELTGGRVASGRVPVTATQVASSVCGL